MRASAPLSLVSDLHLSVRTSNCLSAAGIGSVRDLLQLTATDLLTVSNLGASSLADIEKALESHGLRLGMSEDEMISALDFNNPAAVRELGAFLAAVNAAGHSEVASLVACDGKELLEEGRLDADSLADLKAGLERWGLLLGLAVAQESAEAATGNPETLHQPANLGGHSFAEDVSALLSHLLREGSPTQLQCFLSYYDLNGHEKTLESIAQNGQNHGFARPVTRERVRQVLEKARSRIRSFQPPSSFPHWDAALRHVRVHSPLTPESLLSLLGYEDQEGAVRTFKRLEELIELIGLSFPLELQSLGADERLVFFTAAENSNAWIGGFRNLPPTPFAVVSEVAGALGCSSGRLRRALDVSQRWELLEPTGNYFWKRPRLPPRNYAKTGNAVLSALCKVFFAGGRASSTDLAISLGRDRMVRQKRRGPPCPLPKEVIEGIAERSGLFRVKEGQIERRCDRERWDAVTERDMALLRVISKHGRVVSSRVLYSSLVRGGLSEGNAGQVVQYSPVLVHTQSGVGETEGLYRFVLDSAPSEPHGGPPPAQGPLGPRQYGQRAAGANVTLEMSARTLHFGTFYGPEAVVLANGRWAMRVNGAEVGEARIQGQEVAGLQTVTRVLCLKKGDRLELVPSEAADGARVLDCRRLDPACWLNRSPQAPEAV